MVYRKRLRGMFMAKRITITDVARAAGVSSQTVSRALNDKGEISAETKARIIRIMKELGFRPNYIARSLATQQTTTIGIVVPDITNPFFSDIVRGVEDAARLHSYNVFLCNTDESEKREILALNSLLEKQVDGVIICSSRLDENVLKNKLEYFSFSVLINREVKDTFENVRMITFDDTLGACMAVSYLVQCGHQKIAFLAGPQHSQSGIKRLNGYYSCLQENNLRIDPGLVIFCDPSFQGGIDAYYSLQDVPQEATAILCYNDLVGIGVIHAALTNHRNIPEDLAIIGFDDIPMAMLIRPPLTTVRLPKREVGAAAMQILIDRKDGKELPEMHKVFPPELILRGTTQ
jgi:LacI family transcriptional regulator